jgi:phage terminase large subunit-like protein
MAGRTLAYARDSYRWAMKRGKVLNNPFDDLPVSAGATDRDRVLTDAELSAVWTASCTLPYPFGPFFQMAILTLQRREEVAGMRWSEISAGMNVWTIPATRMKNARPHDVHLTDAARAVLRALPKSEACDYVFTTWANGAQATAFSAEEPDRLRGPQHEVFWGDEVAAWANAQDTWDMAMFGLRLGDHPRAMVTTTPKPLPIIRDLVSDPRNVVTRGTTWDNRTHLPKSFFDQVVAKYEGTRLGRQELNAEILEDADGALWRRDMIRRGHAPKMIRVVVGVDPPASSSGNSALAGIVVCGLGIDGRGYVLADYSARMSPGEWGRTAVQAYDEWRADRIVAEGNQGGEMVRHTIQTVRENVPVTIVYASRGKQARAEPVAALYEQGKVDHVGTFPELEDQMATWEPLSAMASPDRLDAMVWAMTDLAIGGGPRVYPQAVEQFVCEPIPFPSIWQRVCAIDFDHSHVAAVWGAVDRPTDTIYLYDEYLAPRAELAIAADKIRKRGYWIPALFDWRARGRSEAEGFGLAERLVDLGVNLSEVEVDREAGVAALSDRLSSGRLRVFGTLDGYLKAYRQYQRDEAGRLVETGDHLMKAAALLALYGRDVAITENRARNTVREVPDWRGSGRSPTTGY